MTLRFDPPRSWLILSHAFNMDGRAASQTITDKIPHLISRGIKPVAMSGVMGHKDKLIPHYQLLPLGFAALRFDLRFVLRKWITNRTLYKVCTAALSLVFAPFIALEKVIFGRQSHWSWAFSAYLFGLWAIHRHKIDCIYSTGGSYSAHSAGLWLKRTTGLPLIMEIHDPLVFRGQQDVRLSKRDAAYQAKLEGFIASQADLAWWFSQAALESAQSRHPALLRNGIAITPGAAPPAVESHYTRGSKLIFSHFGSLSHTRSLNRFIAALGLAIKKVPALQPLVELHVYGSDLDGLSQEAITQTNLNSLIKVHGRLEFDPITGLDGRERVRLQMYQADVLLLVHGEIDNCAEYIPSKLYEYFWGYRPIFGLTHLNPQMDDLITARGGYYAGATDETAIASRIIEIYEEWLAAVPNKAFFSDGQAWRPSVPPIGIEGAVDDILKAMQARNL